MEHFDDDDDDDALLYFAKLWMYSVVGAKVVVKVANVMMTIPEEILGVVRFCACLVIFISPLGNFRGHFWSHWGAPKAFLKLL